jgi:predicted ATP-grasp superfamily ATP-dependent carboligase
MLVRALIVHPGDDREIRPRGVLAAARGLAAAGWTVGVGSPARDFVAASRSSRHWHRVPYSWEGAQAFIEATKAAVDEGDYEVVFGACDADALALSGHREELGALVPYPPHERVLGAFDKLHLASAARRVGLETPRTVEGHFTEREVVVKERLYESVPHEAMVFADSGQAAVRIAQLDEAGSEPLVQERVRGELMAYVVVADPASRVVAQLQQEAPAIWPLDAGVSARAETVPIDAALAAKVSRLVGELGWFGLAQFQFLVPENGSPVLIDFNGRFYGSLALGVAAGVNLPAIWASVATGRPFSHPRAARAGVRYQWLEGDLRRAREQRRRGLARDLAGSVRYFLGAAHAYWSAADPAPAFRVFRRVASGWLRFRLQAPGRKNGPGTDSGDPT